MCVCVCVCVCVFSLRKSKSHRCTGFLLVPITVKVISKLLISIDILLILKQNILVSLEGQNITLVTLDSHS